MVGSRAKPIAVAIAPRPALTVAEGHAVYAAGLLGSDLLPTYLELMRRKRPPAFTPAPARARAPALFSAWGGLGGELILGVLRSKKVSDRLWRRFREGVSRARRLDFFSGVEGAMPVLALVAASRGREGVDLTVQTHSRVRRRLRRLLASHRAGRGVNLGFAHGVAGSLCAYEIGNALLGADDDGLRPAAIDLLMASAKTKGARSLWPAYSRTGLLDGLHALCNGGPGIGLAALLGARYSQDGVYGPLIEATLSTVGVRSENDTFCCGSLGRIEVLIEAYRTTGDANLLAVARSLFDKVEPDKLRGTTWQHGLGGYQLTALRLEDPAGVDLPGLPLELVPLRRARAAGRRVS